VGNCAMYSSTLSKCRAMRRSFAIHRDDSRIRQRCSAGADG
jgi:hypothetical protein